MSEEPGTVTSTKAKGCPGWMKALLVVSLVANIAIAGLFIGHGMKDKPGGGANRQINWIIELVPENKREAVEDRYAKRREDMRKTRADRARHMRSIIAAIRAEPFSPEELSRHMRLRREAGDARRTIVHTELIAVLVEFSPDERQHFADRIEERVEGWAKQLRQRN